MTNERWRKLQCWSTRYELHEWNPDWEDYNDQAVDQPFDWTSRHHGSEGLKGALNYVLIMPRDASLSDSRYEFFPYGTRHINLIIDLVFKSNIWHKNYSWIYEITDATLPPFVQCKDMSLILCVDISTYYRLCSVHTPGTVEIGKLNSFGWMLPNLPRSGRFFEYNDSMCPPKWNFVCSFLTAFPRGGVSRVPGRKDIFRSISLVLWIIVEF